jgi:hypothetical protein
MISPVVNDDIKVPLVSWSFRRAMSTLINSWESSAMKAGYRVIKSLIINEAISHGKSGRGEVNERIFVL